MEQPLGRRKWPLALALVLAPFARRYRRKWWASLSLFVVIAAGVIFSLGVSACGGGSGKQTTPSQQTYALTVTATSGTLTQSTHLTLILE
jgi:hypothetical protein